MVRGGDDWSTIAVQDDTKDRLADMKRVKARGRLENYDDVIRREMKFDELEESKKDAQ